MHLQVKGKLGHIFWYENKPTLLDILRPVEVWLENSSFRKLLLNTNRIAGFVVTQVLNPTHIAIGEDVITVRCATEEVITKWKQHNCCSGKTATSLVIAFDMQKKNLKCPTLSCFTSQFLSLPSSIFALILGLTPQLHIAKTNSSYKRL